MNPLLALHPSFFEREIFAVDRHFAKNARTLRGVLRSVVESKKEALKKGEVGEEAKFDVVTLLLQDESYTNIEHMIDDALIAVVFGASAVATVTTNLITSLLHEPEALTKLRAELCRLPRKKNNSGMIELYTKADMVAGITMSDGRKLSIPSPNLADDVMMSL